MNWLWRSLLDLDLVLLNSKYPAVASTRSVKLLRNFVVKRVRSSVLHHAIQLDRARAKRQLSHIPELQEIYTDYLQETRSTGVEVSDYVRLYQAVRALKPTAVLECGTGLSTTAIAFGLKHNEEEHGVKGHCVSMEELAEWFEHAKEMLPRQLEDYVEIVLCPRVEKEYNGILGVCYQNVPDQEYQFVFVDGPNENSPITGDKLFDMDFVYVAERNPLAWGFVDHRLNTIRYLKQALSETHHVTYNPVSKLGYIYPKGCAQKETAPF